MVVFNQDHDLILNLSTKDIFFKKHYALIGFRIIFTGWSLYARTQRGRALLGTFDSPGSCRAVVAEMKQHEKAGIAHYVVPEESDGLEEDEVEGGVANV